MRNFALAVAIGGKADMPFCSAHVCYPKRTSVAALHMSAFNPKQTCQVVLMVQGPTRFRSAKNRKSSPKCLARNYEDQFMTNSGFRLVRFAVLVVSIGTFSTPSFSEGTPEQRRACKDDAFRLCRDTIPDVPRITECMHKNQKKLCPACKVFFKPG